MNRYRVRMHTGETPLVKEFQADDYTVFEAGIIAFVLEGEVILTVGVANLISIEALS